MLGSPENLVKLHLKTHWQMIAQNPLDQLCGIKPPLHRREKHRANLLQRTLGKNAFRPLVVTLGGQHTLDFVMLPKGRKIPPAVLL